MSSSLVAARMPGSVSPGSPSSDHGSKGGFPLPSQMGGRGRQDGRSAALDECSRLRLINPTQSCHPGPQRTRRVGPGVRWSRGEDAESSGGKKIKRSQMTKSGIRGACGKSA
ncbi:hypothetical protein NDU88_012003 [Pleurodeles waltl]|uniref:Uncharacterized protein n=1 Tax=Pleurodeles waltl TaxID=8319 RepID=A0AAV7R093_PLEWA|nr:hypothetical protein NDU88_012003 [Pleurodeles waltl]